MEHPEIIEFESDSATEGFALTMPDVTYSEKHGLKLTLIMPWASGDGCPRRPLVVFVQGSAWQRPDTNFELPQLSQLAREGYVVATIVHRNALDGNPFPAYLEDTKTAIRFLRANADKFGIDPARVGIFGTSSGGNTALLVGLTGDSPEFVSDEYRDESDTVKLVVDCFGPADMPNMIDAENVSPDSDKAVLFGALAGDADPWDVMRRMSPINYVDKCGEKPVFYLLHGDADPVVPYEQSVSMYEKLLGAGAQVQMARVHGAPHEGAFWSRALLKSIFGFIKENL